MANYQDSPFGVGRHIHVNKADSKFKPNAPEFKVDLELEGDEALAFKEKVDAQSEAAMENFKQSDQFEALKKKDPKKARSLEVYYPYEEEEDEDGNKTGKITFKFVQNEIIKLRDGTTKKIKVGIYDAKGNEFNKIVRAGSELRVKFSFRAIPAISLGIVGVRMDFMGVQVRKLATGNSGGGFSAVEGYEDDGQSDFSAAEDDANSPDTSSSDADY